MNIDSKKLDNLIPNSINKGDTISYETLSDLYFDSPQFNYNFLNISLIMANKYEYREAYYNVFICLTQYYSDSSYLERLANLDKPTQKFALDYLIIAAKKGSKNAAGDLKKVNNRNPELLKKSLIEDSSLKKLLKVI